MTNSDFVDMAPVFARHDRRTRQLMIAVFAISLALSAAIAARMLASGDAGPRGPIWSMGVFYAPALGLFWWTFTELSARRRRKTQPPGDRLLTGPDDARNGMRIMRAGFIFTVGLMVAGIGTQLLMGLMAFRINLGPWFGLTASRVICLVVGGATVYLGNLWPRMPTARGPRPQAAKIMKVNRYVGWVLVAFGLGVALLGVFLPYLTPPPTQPPFEASKHHEIALPQAALDKFAGRYDFGNGFTVDVTHRGRTLWVTRETMPADPGAPVYPEAPARFFWKMVEAQIRFTTDANGAVTGAEFREAGPWRPGKRIAP